MGTKTKNWVQNKFKKSIRNYEKATHQQKQSVWLLTNEGQIRELSDRKYKIHWDGSWRRID